jgi:hypothetical protein
MERGLRGLGRPEDGAFDLFGRKSWTVSEFCWHLVVGYLVIPAKTPGEPQLWFIISQ